MNKFNKLLIVPMMSLFLISCNSNVDNITSTLINNSGDTVIPTSNNSEPEEDFEIELNKVYSFNIWDYHIDELMKYSIDEQYLNIPVFTALSYEAFVSEIVDGNEKIIYTNIKCFGVNSTSSTRIYKEKLEEKGFFLSSETSLAFRMIDYYSDLNLYYGLSKDENDKEFFNLQMFNKQSREKEWNSELIHDYMEYDVPKCEAESYSYAFDQYRNQLLIYANFVPTSRASEYADLLQKDYQYTLTATDSGAGYQLVDNSGYLTITIYQTYGDYNCDAVYIVINNAWPTVPIGAFLGVYLPKLEISETSSAKYDGYSYMDPVGNDKDEDYVITIYYVNASVNDYVSYLSQFKKVGFNQGETTTSDTGIMSTYFNAIRDDGYNLEVGVLYQTSSSTICVVVYQAYK